MLQWQERERLKYLSNLSRFKKYQPKFVGNLQVCGACMPPGRPCGACTWLVAHR